MSAAVNSCHTLIESHFSNLCSQVYIYCILHSIFYLLDSTDEKHQILCGHMSFEITFTLSELGQKQD